jgi:hypothetical protein
VTAPIVSPFANLRVERGQPMSHKWANRVADIITGQSLPATRFGSLNRLTIKVTNIGNDLADELHDRGPGELLAYHEYTGIEVPEGETPVYDPSSLDEPPDMPHLSLLQHLSFDARRPHWHDDLHRIGITVDGAIKDAPVELLLYGLALARVTITSDQHTHVMMDPENPERMVSSTGGLGRIIWSAEDVEYAAILWGDTQNLFRYELTESWQAEGTEAKLLNLDTTDAIGGSERIMLTDEEGLMDDQSSGDRGYCLMVGNKFIPIQAACS